MKKAIILSIATICIMSACGNETQSTSKSVPTHKKRKDVENETTLKSKQELEKARKVDSLRQVKEHGHAH